MRRGDLLIIAERAIELVPKTKLQALVGDYVNVDDVAEASATPPLATSKSPTYGHPNSPRQDRRNCNAVARGGSVF